MCPNINLLKTYKVYPRKIDFNYLKDNFFIYIYLDPFQELEKPKAYNIQNKEYCFAYMPIYVGKGTGSGYRQNQHIASFLSGRENNQIKVNTLKIIQEKMADAAAKGDHTKPWNWKEYQDGYVIILETFNDPKQLLKYEMELIQGIGTIVKHTGPLTNKIINAYKFDNLGTGRQMTF
jgi:hypothetical protein